MRFVLIHTVCFSIFFCLGVTFFDVWGDPAEILDVAVHQAIGWVAGILLNLGHNAKERT